MQGETERTYASQTTNAKIGSEPKLNQPIDQFFNEQKQHEKNMIENYQSLANLLNRLDTVANRLAPHDYYQNTPQVEPANGINKELPPFEYPHGGIYSGLNEVMQTSRVQSHELLRQIDELRRKVLFFEQFI